MMIARMRHLLPALLGLAAALLAPAASRAGEARCGVPETMLFSDSLLPGVARQVRAGGPLRVAILGSNSSLAQPGRGAPVPYAASLAAELERRLPGIQVVIENHSARSLGAERMAAIIAEQVVPARPHLLVWQTGAVEAAQQVDVNRFAITLAAGLQTLQDARIDAVLVSPQFRSRLAVMVDAAAYNSHMAHIGEAWNVLVFPRYDIMRYWVEHNAFDLRGGDTDRQKREADAENVCLAEHLAAMIAAAAKAN